MTKEQTISRIKEHLDGKIIQWHDKSVKRIYVEVSSADVPDVSRLMFRDLGARFQIASGIDTPSAIEILYHWAFDALGFVVTIETKLNRESPVVESIARICPAAEWIEREMWELLGVQFKNHPDLRHLLLMDDWPEGKYPLRRDYIKGKDW